MFTQKWGRENGPQILIGYSLKSKMATSGSDETELDSESVIDPDSLSHCSDMPPVTKKRRTSVSKKISVCKFKRSWSLLQHITFSSKVETPSPTAAFVQATFLFRMAGLTTSNCMYQDLFTSKDRRTRVVLQALQRSSRKMHQITDAMSFRQKCKQATLLPFIISLSKQQIICQIYCRRCSQIRR